MFNAAKKAIVVIAATATSAHGVTDAQEATLAQLAHAIDQPTNVRNIGQVSTLAGVLLGDADVQRNERARDLLKGLVRTYKSRNPVATQAQLREIRRTLDQPSSVTNRNRTVPATLPTTNTGGELAERMRVRAYAQTLRALPDNTGRVVSDRNAYVDITEPAASAGLFPHHRHLLTAARNYAKQGSNAAAAASLDEYVRSTGPALTL